jgi:hypothetical protein
VSCKKLKLVWWKPLKPLNVLPHIFACFFSRKSLKADLEVLLFYATRKPAFEKKTTSWFELFGLAFVF